MARFYLKINCWQRRLRSPPRCKMDRRLLPWMVLVVSTSSARPIYSSTINNHRGNNCLACINTLRGGAPYYESNPNYENSPTLGDVDNDGYIYQSNFRSPLRNSSQRPPPLTQLISSYFAELRKFSPTLFNGTLGSILLFFAWQLPPSSTVAKILRNHFVCNDYNVVRKRRYHALILAAFSHASFYHILVNMYAFLNFGRSVKDLLASQGLPLWVFVLSAAVFGNPTFLAFDRHRNGSCIGLSGVTLALLAFNSLIYPKQELRVYIAFFPITLPAYHLFLGLLCFSFIGIFGFAGRSNVAHSTHLGGLVYGALFYEAFKRGWPRVWNYRCRKAYRAIRGG